MNPSGIVLRVDLEYNLQLHTPTTKRLSKAGSGVNAAAETCVCYFCASGGRGGFLSNNPTAPVSNIR